MQAESALLRFEPGLMIWTIGVFVTLLVVLRAVAWKPLLAALDEREKKIHDALDQARQAQAETERVLAEKEQIMDESVKKAEAMLQQARQDAERTRQQMVEEARAESTRIVEQGMKRLEAEQRAAMQEIRQVAGDLAIQAAGRLIQSSLTEPQQRQIVDKFLSEIPEKTVQ